MSFSKGLRVGLPPYGVGPPTSETGTRREGWYQKDGELDWITHQPMPLRLVQLSHLMNTVRGDPPRKKAVEQCLGDLRILCTDDRQHETDFNLNWKCNGVFLRAPYHFSMDYEGSWAPGLSEDTLTQLIALTKAANREWDRAVVEDPYALRHLDFFHPAFQNPQYEIVIFKYLKPLNHVFNILTFEHAPNPAMHYRVSYKTGRLEPIDDEPSLVSILISYVFLLITYTTGISLAPTRLPPFSPAPTSRSVKELVNPFLVAIFFAARLETRDEDPERQEFADEHYILLARLHVELADSIYYKPLDWKNERERVPKRRTRSTAAEEPVREEESGGGSNESEEGEQERDGERDSGERGARVAEEEEGDDPLSPPSPAYVSARDDFRAFVRLLVPNHHPDAMGEADFEQQAIRDERGEEDWEDSFATVVGDDQEMRKVVDQLWKEEQAATSQR